MKLLIMSIALFLALFIGFIVVEMEEMNCLKSGGTVEECTGERVERTR